VLDPAKPPCHKFSAKTC